MESFIFNTNERKEFRVLYKKAYLYYCENLLTKGMNSFVAYKEYSIEIRQKRLHLEAVVKKVDLQ